MKKLVIVVLALLLTSCSSLSTIDLRSYSKSKIDALYPELYTKRWAHGSINCELNPAPSLEVYRNDDSSYIIRQNKCSNFEAPFIYVLFGEEKVVILDTGAAGDPIDFPIYQTVEYLIGQQIKLTGNKKFEWLVIHSHSHSDHYKGDVQFTGMSNVTVVAPNHKAMTQFFAFEDWPSGNATLDLGNRELIVIPTPGHQEEAISIYDPKTKWLLTGDSLYPGYIYVKDWDDYKESINRLASFTKQNEVSAILGAHIEMKTESGEYYPIGSTFQPDEVPLALTTEQLVLLNQKLNTLQEPQKIVMNKFIIEPMSSLIKVINRVAKWFL